MHIQGTKLKRDRDPQKSSLYEFDESRVIIFREKDTRDVVEVEYSLEESDKGFYAKEYRPHTVSRQDANVIDITAFIINEEKNTCRWRLYDVKQDVGGKDVIRHLCQQWKASYRYLHHSIFAYLDEDIVVDGNVGVITHHFDDERIKKEFQSISEKIKKVEADKDDPTMHMLALRKGHSTLPILREYREFLKNMMQRKVCFRDAGQNVELLFDVKIASEDGEGNFYCQLVV